VVGEAQARQRLMSEQLAAARAFEQAEAGLVEGAALLVGELPAPCQGCLPPAIPLEAPGPPWQATDSGFVLLQNLGSSERVAGLPVGKRASLIRVTALSLEPRRRRVLEAVYALDDAEQLQRISWRQRLPES